MNNSGNGSGDIQASRPRSDGSSLCEIPLVFDSMQHAGDQHHSLDTLRILPYAEALRDFIHACDTPITIGIQGDWGIGKTSLMNMLRGSEGCASSGLLEDARCRVISLETWPYAQFHSGNDLVIACLQALVNRMRDALLPLVTDQESMERVAGSAMERLVNLRGRLWSDPLQTPSGEDIADLVYGFRSDFQTLVKAWIGASPIRRAAVFVDDLDRMPAAEALMLLEALKNFASVAGCVFVIAIEYEVLQKGVAERLGSEAQKTSGKALYDKLIQLPFQMPTAAYQLEEYITGLLRQTDFPFAQELAVPEANREFLVNITLCTIGRNPRNIKRALSYSSLLERVRARQGNTEFTARDAQILYALICMQIAWPELFNHFVNDPTVDAVTCLQNWDFLERLPEAHFAFQRELDSERVKLNIGTFFDTLLSLLDENDDGQVDSKELEPVWRVMHLACMTAVSAYERPRDWFVRRVRENNQEQDPLIDTFLSRVYMRSVWYLGSDCRYRRSGSRYVTLVYQGRQIGTLVSLRQQPFVFRLALPPEKVKAGLKAYWTSKHEVHGEAITLTRSVFGKEASMTGFGDTVVDYSRLTRMPAEDAIGLLNALFRIAISDELQDWERDKKGKKKR